MPRPERLSLDQAWGCGDALLRRRQELRQEGDGGRPHDLHRHHALRLLRRYRLPYDHLYEKGNGNEAGLFVLFIKLFQEQRDQEDANLYKIYVEAARYCSWKFRVCEVSLFVFDEFH